MRKWLTDRSERDPGEDAAAAVSFLDFLPAAEGQEWGNKLAIRPELNTLQEAHS